MNDKIIRHWNKVMQYRPIEEPVNLENGTMQSVTANGQKLLLANVDGNYYAIGQKCPHMGANLCKGKLIVSIVTCPMHKADFNVTTGKVTEDPKVLFWKMKTKDATTFRVKNEGNILEIEI